MMQCDLGPWKWWCADISVHACMLLYPQYGCTWGYMYVCYCIPSMDVHGGTCMYVIVPPVWMYMGVHVCMLLYPQYGCTWGYMYVCYCIPSMDVHGGTCTIGSHCATASSCPDTSSFLWELRYVDWYIMCEDSWKAKWVEPVYCSNKPNKKCIVTHIWKTSC